MADYPRFLTMAFSDSDEVAGLLAKTQARTIVYEKVEWTIRNAEGKDERRGLRYGENPSQPATLYRPINGHLILAGVEFVSPEARLVGGLDEQAFVRFGKHPSKTNLTDIDAGLAILKHLSEFPAAIIMKHNNPSGAAIADTLDEAYRKAWESDPIAPFGGAIVVNRPMTKGVAEHIASQYYEVVAAPEFEEGVIDTLAARSNLRIVRMPQLARLGDWARTPYLDIKAMQDGALVCQQSYAPVIGEDAQPLTCLADFKRLGVVPRDVPERAMVDGRLKRTGRAVSIEAEPTEDQWRDMWFGWIVQTGVTSNSVLLAKDGATVAIACGGQDRVLISKQCVWKAYETRKALAALRRTGMLYDLCRLEVQAGRLDKQTLKDIEAEAALNNAGIDGAVACSDAFFPFRDGPDALLDAGVRAIVHPGGSLRDSETIDACNERGASMVWTAQRCFRH
ncbi:MAG: Bifunctional purine biosynthesis protein PurH [candidate division BRC1 bacterium ADurb.BinA364]|nr:MAG: Bifunctional purine biosynthesis protein PurH [candidate division BRC1 bacterium ADurb.BinA364]